MTLTLYITKVYFTRTNILYIHRNTLRATTTSCLLLLLEGLQQCSGSVVLTSFLEWLVWILSSPAFPHPLPNTMMYHTPEMTLSYIIYKKINVKLYLQNVMSMTGSDRSCLTSVTTSQFIFEDLAFSEPTMTRKSLPDRRR